MKSGFEKFLKDNETSIQNAARQASDYFRNKNVKIKPFPGIDVITDVSPIVCEVMYKDILYEMAKGGSSFGFKNGLLIAAIPNQEEPVKYEIRFGIFI